jgi:acetyl-CoA carboxylase biotin carboxyl carrier protein
MNINEIKEIIAIVTSSDITKFNYSQNDMNILIERGTQQSSGETASVIEMAKPSAPVVSTILHPGSDKAAEARTKVEEPNENLIEIKAPLVGVYYEKPSPTSDHFIKAGDIVKAGHTLCIIEAMKVMNEIPAEFDMKIVDILGKDSELVEFDQVIILAEKL